MSQREQFLDRVRLAVREGNRAGGAPPLPVRGNVGYQGAGSDPVAKLRDELAAAGGVLHLAANETAAVEILLGLVQVKNARRVLLAGGSVIDGLRLAPRLKQLEVEVLGPDAGKEAHFSAELAISGIDHVVAETGTLVLATRPEQPRAASLLPPVHVAVARREQVVADLFDLFGTDAPPACLTLITGPSKTGDIELKLVTGVHGPGEVHLVLIG